MDYSTMEAEEIYERGCELLDDGETDAGIELLKVAAEMGYVDAQTHLGDIYCYSDIVEEDCEEALKWYRLAAEEGDITALIEVAEAYRYGAGVEEDFEECLKWYKLAAEAGAKEAMYTVGYEYYHGDEVEKSYEEAYKWFAMDGFRELPYYICADMYFYVDKDYENAFRLYCASLENDGYEDAAYKIGEMYYYGLGTEQDYGLAIEYLKYYEGDFEEDDFDFAPAKVNYMLAEMYKNGWGVEQNLNEAEKLFRAAEKSEQAQ